MKDDITYRGCTIIYQRHPMLLPFAIYHFKGNREKLLGVAETVKEAKAKIDALCCDQKDYGL